MAVSNVQDAFRHALRDSGINKPASVHTLRHSYATSAVADLKRASTCVKSIPPWRIGHNSQKTTALYTHLTGQGFRQTQQIVNLLMEGL